MLRLHKILIAVDSGISATLIIIGITIRQSLTNQISNLTQQEIQINATTAQYAKSLLKMYPAAFGAYEGYYTNGTQSQLTSLGYAWEKDYAGITTDYAYNGKVIYHNFNVSNATLTAYNKIILQMSHAQASLQTSSLGANLIVAGLIGFGIVGLCCLIGYSIHKHIINIVNKKQAVQKS